MDNLLLNLFESTSGVFAYGAVFSVLLLCGMGLPIPEDVSLILGGYLVFKQQALLPVMMVTGYLGIIIGDSLMFMIGRHIGGGRLGTTGFFGRLFTTEKRERVAGLFARHGEKIVMIARFLPGVRAVTYFTAGSVKMKYSHFIFFDSVAALVSAPVFVLLGWRFGGELDELIRAVRHGQTRVLIGMAVVVVGYVVATRLWNRWRAKKNGPPPPAPPSPPGVVAGAGQAPERAP